MARLSNPRGICHLAIVLAGVLAAAACAIPLQAGADFDPAMSFDRYTTFDWDEADALPTGDPRLDNNPFFVERLHVAIQSELARRGIRRSTVAPGLIVHHHATVRDRVEVFEADRGRGYESTEYGAGTKVIQWEEGMFLVDIADAETRQVIWRGWAKADIESALADPGTMTRLVRDSVAAMFQRFRP